jgi:hypothetical protein
VPNTFLGVADCLSKACKYAVPIEQGRQVAAVISRSPFRRRDPPFGAGRSGHLIFKSASAIEFHFVAPASIRPDLGEPHVDAATRTQHARD